MFATRDASASLLDPSDSLHTPITSGPGDRSRSVSSQGRPRRRPSTDRLVVSAATLGGDKGGLRDAFDLGLPPQPRVWLCRTFSAG